jgi:hypothetical protein
MKKIPLILFLFFAVVLGSAGQGKTWYKCFKGKIGNDPVTFNIHRFDDHAGGYYYYDKYMAPFILLGDFSGDSLRIFSYVTSYSGENFNGILKSGVYSGEWSQDDSDRKMNFRMEEDRELSAMFDYVMVKDERMFFKNYAKSPEATYLEAAVWPGDRNQDKKKLRYIICSEKNFPKDLTVISSELHRRQKEFFEGYFEQNKGLTKKEIEDIGYPSSWNLEEEDHLQLVYMDDHVINLSSSDYLYSGGAHGNYATHYGVYDINNKTRLKLGDVMFDNYIDSLPVLLDKNYRLQNKVPDSVKRLSEGYLAVDTIYVTDNFGMTPGCVFFDYPPYDIASYADGEIRIYIPIEEVKNYLTPLALNLFRRKN